MLITVPKKKDTLATYATLSSALSAATSSGVWHDDDTSAMGTAKRRNHIRARRNVMVDQKHSSLETLDA